MADTAYITYTDVLEVLKNLAHEKFSLSDNFQPYIQALTDASDKILEIPSADVVEVKHGKWEHDTDGITICSHCGEIALQRIMLRFPDNQYFSQFVHSNFCPRCGTRMDGE